ncbi:hypothetical protein [Stutzerimonas kunmingensis]|uniref:hypothetical protein n=1 Tax=Stutzerimonas kunmingensis TaxID=1211807 RepID=UPI0028A0F469|nr:hypothetical protein [Stutzerimonas kunmingensis]
MQYDNPAERLLSILTDGKSISGDQSCKRVWEGLLNVPKNEGALLVSRIGKAMSLPQEIIDRTRELYPNRSPTWLHWSNQVNAAFSTQNINGQWQTFIQHIDNHTITYLQMSTDLLESKSSIKPLDLDEIIQISEKVNDLLVDVISSPEIEASIKKYIVHHLRKILISIDEYKITGALPILDAVETTIGHAYLDEGYRNLLKNSEIGARILDTLSATANLVTVAVGIPQIAQTFLQLGGGN